MELPMLPQMKEPRDLIRPLFFSILVGAGLGAVAGLISALL
jgi:hypothetical protein